MSSPPSRTRSDPNYNFYWDFAEFTFNDSQLFANITYVDFVSLPVALKLQSTSGQTSEVQGMSSTALDSVCSQLVAQNAKDGAGWSNLIIKSPSGANLRALSPNSGIVMNNNLFKGYYQPYVNAVWAKYSSSKLTLDTQVQWGVLTGQVSNNLLSFSGVGSFPQPSAADIFSCNSGAFGHYDTNSDEMGNITARLAAAFNRSTLLINSSQPDGEQVSKYYQESITNHYSRIVHSVNAGGKGYAFPYDDVAPSDAQNVAGTVSDGSPTLLTVSIGGTNVSARAISLKEMARTGGRTSQQVGGRPFGRIRRALDWSAAAEPSQEMREMVTAGPDADRDLEQGPLYSKLEAELARTEIPQLQPAAMARSLHSLVPGALERKASDLLERVEGSPAYAYARPVVDTLAKAVMALLSMSVRTAVSRVVMVLFLVLCSFLLGFFGRAPGDGVAVGLEHDAGPSL